MTRPFAVSQHRVLHAGEPGRDLDVRFRRPTDGPENDLVDSFLSQLRFRLPVGLELTLFKEPWLQSGAPDLVGVLWDRKTAEQWKADRRWLTPFDLRLIHHLIQTGVATTGALEKLFNRRIRSSLEKLESVDMVRRKGDSISARSLSRIYATRHIFAIEAKMTVWQSALSQAMRNRWFATTSHILVPHIPSGGRLLEEADRLNVGVITGNETTFDCRYLALARSPESYCSWLFNEWTWRAESMIFDYAPFPSTLDSIRISGFTES